MQVPSVNSFQAPELPSASRIPVQVLDQADFLQLFTAQMTSQDPLNPKSDTDYIGQMAQFSALEQGKLMQSDMAKLQANSLIGRLVEFQDQDTLYHGVVEAVQMDAGKPQLVVHGRAFDLSTVRAIEPAPTTST